MSNYNQLTSYTVNAIEADRNSLVTERFADVKTGAFFTHGKKGATDLKVYLKIGKRNAFPVVSSKSSIMKFKEGTKVLPADTLTTVKLSCLTAEGISILERNLAKTGKKSVETTPVAETESWPFPKKNKKNAKSKVDKKTEPVVVA